MFIFLYVPVSLQCFDAVGLVFWPVKVKDNPFRKPVSEMTYTVSGGTLNPTQLVSARQRSYEHAVYGQAVSLMLLSSLLLFLLSLLLLKVFVINRMHVDAYR